MITFDVTGLLILFGVNVFFKTQCYYSNGIAYSVPKICVLGSPVETDTDTLEQVQMRATRTIKGLEQVTCKERLKELLCSVTRREGSG